MQEEIARQFNQNIELNKASQATLVLDIEKAAISIAEALKNGNKVLFCGNGGSAADSQHIAAELVGRFKKERAALPAIALTTDTSIITALANDYEYSIVYSRQVEALGQEGDVLVGFSTSGNSANVLKAVETARTKGLITIGFLGADGGKLKGLVDIALVVPYNGSDRVQEIHILIGHIVCDLVESSLFSHGK